MTKIRVDAKYIIMIQSPITRLRLFDREKNQFKHVTKNEKMTTFKRLTVQRLFYDAGRLFRILFVRTLSRYTRIIARSNFYNRAITLLRYRITCGSLGPDIAIPCYYCCFEVVVVVYDQCCK